MSSEFLFLSVLVGLLYGWASAHWSSKVRPTKPRILRSPLINLSIGLLALIVIIESGVDVDSPIGLLFSFLVVLASALVANLYTTAKIHKTQQPNSEKNNTSSEQSVASLIIETSDFAIVRTRHILNASHERLNALSTLYHYFCLLVIYKEFIGRGVSNTDAYKAVSIIVPEIAVIIANPEHLSKLEARYVKGFEEAVAAYGDLPLSSPRNSVCSEFVDLLIASSQVTHKSVDVEDELRGILEDVITSLKGNGISKN